MCKFELGNPHSHSCDRGQTHMEVRTISHQQPIPHPFSAIAELASGPQQLCMIKLAPKHRLQKCSSADPAFPFVEKSIKPCLVARGLRNVQPCKWYKSKHLGRQPWSASKATTDIYHNCHISLHPDHSIFYGICDE